MPTYTLIKKLFTLTTAAVFLSAAAFAVEPTATDAKTKKIVSQIKSIEKRISKVNRELKGIRKQNIRLTSEITNLQEQENSVTKQLKKQIEGFNQTAQTIVRVERLPLQALAFSGDLRSGHQRQFVITQGRRSLSDKIDDSRVSLKGLQAIQKKREESLGKIMALEEKQANRKKHLNKLFASQLKLLRLSNKEQAALLEESHKMKQAKALQDLLALRKTATHKVTKVSQNYGKLPTKGHISRKFQEKNELGIKSRGVTIESIPGADVVAMKDGRVIYNGPFRDYGQIIILEHDEKLHSLYSGALKSELKLGDFIRSGQRISSMPEDENPKLYIEVRSEGKAINPRPWLLAQK